MCIWWGKAHYPSFSVSNGVKQGGNLSLLLFNVYMNDLFVSYILLPNVSECNYLVTIICLKNCDPDIIRQMKKWYVNANVLLRQFSKCSTLVKRYLFKTYCFN